MTNRSSSWRTEPFVLTPAAKDYLWGGSRLNDDFGKGIDMYPLAETWECSTHPDGPSIVASGPMKGRSLTDVLHEAPGMLGNHVRTPGELPILIKMIDAQRDLSVQVHPDDAYAQKYENGQQGKNEMWYVLDAAPGATLIHGLNRAVQPDELRRCVADGTIEKYLQRVQVRPNDVFYIEAGTVHAIGAGVMIVEIQENSNLTYRLYDYNRRDKDGNLRPLHLDKALAVADLTGHEAPRQPMRVLKYRPGCAQELLGRCRYFQVERMLMNTERCRAMVDFRTGPRSFEVLLCVDGCGAIFWAGEKALLFFKGDCIFVPANSQPLKFHGKAQLLRVNC